MPSLHRLVFITMPDSLLQAMLELAGLRAERQLTRKFRSAQTHAVLTAAVQLVRDVHAAALKSPQINPEQLRQLEMGVSEVELLIQGGHPGHADELDDAI